VHVDTSNDKSSATRPTERVDCNRSALAGFAEGMCFVDSTRGVTGRSDIARWDLQKRTNARRTGRTRALQWGLPRLKAE